MAKPTQQQKSKTLRVTVSGSYKGPNKNTESFDELSGVIPRMDDDKVQQMVITRYALIWVQKAKKNDGAGNQVPRFSGFQKLRQRFIDSVDDTYLPEFDKDGKPTGKVTNEPDMRDLSYVDKDIMQMNMEELQDLAAANDLSGVPLYRATSLTAMRRMAFSEYAIKVLGLFEEGTDRESLKKGAPSTNKYDHKTMGFNPHNFEPIIADDQIRRQRAATDMEESIEDSLANENELLQRPKTDAGTPQSALTLKKLQAIADSKNISYNKNTSFKELHRKIFSTQDAA